MEYAVPESWVGKDLRDINMRVRYGVTVVAIRNKKDEEINISPKADSKIKEGDIMIVIGNNNDLKNLRKNGERDMREIIKSNANKTIKFIKSLQMKKYRDEQDKFIIEGEKLMDEALRYMVPISMVMISQSFAESSKHDEYSVILRERKIPMYYSEDSIFKGVCETHTPQGIIAVVEKPEYDFDNIISKDKLSIILLHELRDRECWNDNKNC